MCLSMVRRGTHTLLPRLEFLQADTIHGRNGPSIQRQKSHFVHQAHSKSQLGGGAWGLVETEEWRTSLLDVSLTVVVDPRRHAPHEPRPIHAHRSLLTGKTPRVDQSLRVKSIRRLPPSSSPSYAFSSRPRRAWRGILSERRR